MPADPHAVVAELLDRFADVSEAAVRACEAGDTDLIEQALAAREALLSQARDSATMAAGLRMDAAWQARIARVNAVGAALKEAMATLRDGTRRDIEALDRQRAGASTYNASERTSSVDYRR